VTEDEFFQYLILNGAITPARLDPDTNEMLYSFTDKLNEIAPSIAKMADEEFHSDILELWQNGLVSMDITESNPIVKLTDLAFDDEAVGNLSKNAADTLKIISEAMRK
jgi:tRNA A-37 threonylcarbamoyl transferase component Bud32